MQNPQNPYSNPSGMPPSGSPPSGFPPISPVFPGRGPELTLDAIGQAWKLLQTSLGTWVGAFLIYALISGLVNGVQRAVSPRGPNGLPHTGPLSLLFSLLGFVLGQFSSAV